MEKTGMDEEDVVFLMSSYIPLIHPQAVYLYVSSLLIICLC
jgi:hypothetical protein